MWSQWYLVDDSGKPVIRRYIRKDGKTKWERYPADKYKSLARQDLELLLKRINVTHEIEKREAEQRYDFDHAYINKRSIEAYEELLRASANDENHINTMITYLNKYLLEYFVKIKKLPDPKFWKKHENSWGLWLESKLAYNTIKQVIFNSNRFLFLLHEKMYPKEIPVIKLNPLSKNKLKAIDLKTTKKTYKYISPEKFKEIIKLAKDNDLSYLIPTMKLCYLFGLRCSESLGLQLQDVFEKTLKIERQANFFTDKKLSYKHLKDLDFREVPYWYSTPDEAYELIENLTPMHPDTLIQKINDLLKAFGHSSHDFRRSFVTRSLSKYHWKEVKNAMGHEDIETTLGYDLTIEVDQNKRWQPTKK